jgi:ABC-2 type transport system ATP-binding protein
MWEIIRELVAVDGVTIFLTTQYLDEADELADRIALLDHGVLVATGTATELKNSVGAASTLDDVFFALTGGIR